MSVLIASSARLCSFAGVGMCCVVSPGPREEVNRSERRWWLAWRTQDRAGTGRSCMASSWDVAPSKESCVSGVGAENEGKSDMSQVLWEKWSCHGEELQLWSAGSEALGIQEKWWWGLCGQVSVWSRTKVIPSLWLLVGSKKEQTFLFFLPFFFPAF